MSDPLGRISRLLYLSRALRILPAAALALSLVATPASAADESIIRVGIAGEPSTLNPFQGWEWYPWTLTYEQLVARDAHYQPVPVFAESYTRSEDGKTWTFKIASDKKWSDGEPATARDVAFTFNFLLDSVGTESELGAGWNNTGEVQNKIESVTAIDDQTVQFVAKDASGWLLDCNFWMLPEHIWGSLTAEEALNTFINPAPLVGSGPFILQELLPGQYMTLDRNPNYHGDIEGNQPAADGVIVEFFQTADAEVQALKSGEIDLAVDIPATQVESLAATPDVAVINAPTPESAFLAFNTQGTAGNANTNATADPAFRDALGYVIDRQLLVDKLLNGQGSVADTMIAPSWLPTYVPDLADIARTFDAPEANARLDAAGYADTNGDGVREDKDGGPLELRLIIHSCCADFAGVGQYVVDWFGQAGVSVTASVLENSVYDEQMAAPADGGGNWELAIGSIWPDQNPDKVMKHLTTLTIGGTNSSHWSDATYDAMYADQSAALDQGERERIVKDMARYVYEQAPQYYLYFRPGTQAHRTDHFEGWRRLPEPDGLLAYSYTPELNFTSVRPVGAAAPSATTEAPSTAVSPAASAAASPAPEPGVSGGIDTGLLVVAGAIVVLVAAVALVLRRRSRA